MSQEADQNRRGFTKLMLKLPNLRADLKLLALQNEHFMGLCGAYDEATATLERLRKSDSQADADMIAEYEAICVDIEREVIMMTAK